MPCAANQMAATRPALRTGSSRRRVSGARPVQVASFELHDIVRAILQPSAASLQALRAAGAERRWEAPQPPPQPPAAEPTSPVGGAAPPREPLTISRHTASIVRTFGSESAREIDARPASRMRSQPRAHDCMVHPSSAMYPGHSSRRSINAPSGRCANADRMLLFHAPWYPTTWHPRMGPMRTVARDTCATAGWRAPPLPSTRAA